MPSAPVQPYLLDERVRRRLPFDLWVPVIALVALLVVAVLAPGLRPGPYVSGVTFDNSSHYAIEVSVSGGTHGASTLLGPIAEKSHTTGRSVYDEGSSWTFRVSTQGRDLGAVVMSRTDLEAGNWHVAVPDRFAEMLARANVPPTD